MKKYWEFIYSEKRCFRHIVKDSSIKRVLLEAAQYALDTRKQKIELRSPRLVSLVEKQAFHNFIKGL